MTIGEDGLIHADAVRVLNELNETTKAQQAFLKSCGDAAWVGDDERRAIRWLLTALVEHRRPDVARHGPRRTGRPRPGRGHRGPAR